MRVVVLVKADAESEAGELPGPELLAAMGRYNEELAAAGIMLEGEGLHPSSHGVRVKFASGERTVARGPFTPTNELVAGYWLWQVKSLDEAVSWLKRAPFDEAEVEIRPIFEPEEFAASDPTGELREREARLRETLARPKR